MDALLDLIKSATDCHSGAAEDLGKPMCRMRCSRCGAETDWLIFDTVTEAKRGIPCEACATEVGPDKHLCQQHATSGFATRNEALERQAHEPTPLEPWQAGLF